MFCLSLFVIFRAYAQLRLQETTTFFAIFRDTSRVYHNNNFYNTNVKIKLILIHIYELRIAEV